MKESKYSSYPEGFERLTRDIIPFYMRPAKKMLMRLFLVILKDG